MLKSLAIGTLTFGLTAGSASAALLVYDGFEAGGATPGAGQYQSEPGFPDDRLNNQGPARTGFVGSWADQGAVAATVYPRVNSSGLTWTSVAGQVLDTTVGSAEIFRSGSIGGSQIKQSARDTDSIAVGQSFYVSSLLEFNAGTESTLRFKVGQGQTGGPRDHFIGFNSSGQLIAGTDNTFGDSGLDLFAADTTHLIVAMFNDGGQGNRTVDVWVNPADLLAPGAADYTFSANHFQGHNLSGVELETQTGQGVVNPSMIFDEIRLGQTFQDVTPFSTAPTDNGDAPAVPEPASAALLAMGTLALLRRR